MGLSDLADARMGPRPSEAGVDWVGLWEVGSAPLRAEVCPGKEEEGAWLLGTPH